jgi:hypothetical protein
VVRDPRAAGGRVPLRVRGDRDHIRFNADGLKSDLEVYGKVLTTGMDWCSAAALDLGLFKCRCERCPWSELARTP